MLKNSFTVLTRFCLPQIAGTKLRKIHLEQNSRMGIYEPDYLDSLKPKFPQYEATNFLITGHDFPVLESYQKFLHNVAEYMELDVSECYALPPIQQKIQRFKPSSAIVDSEYTLATYQRNLQISDLPAPLYPIFLRLAQAALPEGVNLSVVQNSLDYEEIRYVPDRDLLELRSQLEDMQQGVAPAKKKK